MARFVLAALLGVMLAGAGVSRAVAQRPATCTKSDFEAVVDEATQVLVAINNENKPKFQAKLRALKDKRGWTQDQFLKEAAPFVRDRETIRFDRQSEQLLAELTTLGEEGAGSADAPDCNLLQRLDQTMKSLVQAQQAKWDYMFKKVDAALAAP